MIHEYRHTVNVIQAVKEARENSMMSVRFVGQILPTMFTGHDPGIGVAKLAMKKLDVPISAAVRGCALPVAPEAEESTEVALENAELIRAREEV